MGLGVCHKAPVRVTLALLTAALFAPAGSAQTAPDWRKIGVSAVELTLASPATGPVDLVWYSDTGSTLYARTRSGRVFQTADFETWTALENPPDPQPLPAATASRLPEPGARL